MRSETVRRLRTSFEAGKGAMPKAVLTWTRAFSTDKRCGILGGPP
jgi:hypothetical protein